MPDQNPERRSLPANIENDPGNDVVDAEFTDVDDDRRGPGLDALLEAADREAAYQQRRPRSKARFLWFGVVLLLLAGAFIYKVVFRDSSTREAEQSPPAAGWFELNSCMFTRSFDGIRRMTLEADQNAELREPSLAEQQRKEGSDRITKGRWTYDEASKQYAITLNGETTNYSLLSQDGIATCILVKGDFGAANLRDSWFSYSSDDEAPEDDSREDYRYRGD